MTRLVIRMAVTLGVVLLAIQQLGFARGSGPEPVVSLVRLP